MIQEQQKTTSILDKWGHLLYEGERDYKTGSKTSLHAQSSNGYSNGAVSNGYSNGYSNGGYSNGSLAHYNQLIEQHQQQQQDQQQEMLQQLHEQQLQVAILFIFEIEIIFFKKLRVIKHNITNISN